MDDDKMTLGWLLLGILGVGLVASLFWAVPKYRIWQREQSGRAELAEAEWSKKVQIEEAYANLEAEKLNAQSEIERAKGMAEAIRIEGGSLTPEYIQYLWVRQNTFNDKTTIYIPTEANLPILEAERLNRE
jgi:uncharacterized protein HemX